MPRLLLRTQRRPPVRLRLHPRRRRQSLEVSGNRLLRPASLQKGLPRPQQCLLRLVSHHFRALWGYITISGTTTCRNICMLILIPTSTRTRIRTHILTLIHTRTRLPIL